MYVDYVGYGSGYGGGEWYLQLHTSHSVFNIQGNNYQSSSPLVHCLPPVFRVQMFTWDRLVNLCPQSNGETNPALLAISAVRVSPFGSLLLKMDSKVEGMSL